MTRLPDVISACVSIPLRGIGKRKEAVLGDGDGGISVSIPLRGIGKRKDFVPMHCPKADQEFQSPCGE